MICNQLSAVSHPLVICSNQCSHSSNQCSHSSNPWSYSNHNNNNHWNHNNRPWSHKHNSNHSKNNNLSSSPLKPKPPNAQQPPRSPSTHVTPPPVLNRSGPQLRALRAPQILQRLLHPSLRRHQIQPEIGHLHQFDRSWRFT